MLYHKHIKKYKEYVEKQKEKALARPGALLSENEKRISQFESVFAEAKEYLDLTDMLCLGARTGCEVKAAENAGFQRAAGIDLYPLGKNVIQADWNNLPIGNEMFSTVFTNSIDHASDFSALALEIRRVLKEGGRLFFMVMRKQSLVNIDNVFSRRYDYLFWDSEEDLVQGFEEFFFALERTWRNEKWFHSIMRKENGNA